MPNFYSSYALLLAMAVQKVLPDAVRVQSCSTQNEWGYDFLFPRAIEEHVIVEIQRQFGELVKQDIHFEIKTMMCANAQQFFLHHDLPVQAALLGLMPDNVVEVAQVGTCYDIVSEKTVTRSGELSRYLFIEARSFDTFYSALGQVRILRLKGRAFAEKDELKEYVKRNKLAKKYDEKAQQLIALDHGRSYWLPLGMAIRDILIEHWRRLCRKRGFQEVSTPRLEMRLFRQTISPLQDICEHDYAFDCKYENHIVSLVLPTPAHQFIFKKTNDPHCFRFAELYQREVAIYSKETDGLFRTKNSWSDAQHIFCSKDTVKDELISSLQSIQEIGSLLSLDFVYVLRLPKEKKWRSSCIEALQKVGLEYSEEGTPVPISGPRIEAYAEDLRGRKWLISIVGIDDEKKNESFVTIVESLFFSLERVVALLVERDWIEKNRRDIKH